MNSRGPFRRLLERQAGGKLWLRVQTAMVLMLSFAAGIIASHLLLKSGLTHLTWRLPLTVIVSYAAFLALVRIWMSMTGVMSLAVKPDPAYREQEPEEKSAVGDLAEKTGDVVGSIADLGDAASIVDAEGCLPAIGIALFLAVLGFVIAILWWFFGGFFGAASAALIEAGVDTLLAIGMTRAAGGGALNWFEGALRASWKYWLTLIVMAWGVALAVNYVAPGAPTLLQAFKTISGA